MKLIYLYSLFLKLDFLQIELKVELNFSKIEFYAIWWYIWQTWNLILLILEFHIPLNYIELDFGKIEF